jgi:hypothetical protein
MASPEFFICGLVEDELRPPPAPTTLNNLKDRKQTAISKSREEVERRLNCAVQQTEHDATWIEHKKKSALFLIIAGFQFLCSCYFITSTFL